MGRRGTLNHLHVPAWLEKRALFKRLFAYRKLYLSKTKHHHYSQFGEDISIQRVFPTQSDGFFVDVGCFHPKKHNNTFRLYKRGWRGINIDIDAIKIEAFDIARPGDINVACAVGNETGSTSYFSHGVYSLTTTLSEDFANQRSGYQKKETKIDTLDNIIDGTRYKNRPIDFLSVDVEGYDLQVLRSLDFSLYKPRLVAVESQNRLFSKIVDSDLYEFLVNKNYCLVGWCGLTLLMASPELQQEMESDTETSSQA